MSEEIPEGDFERGKRVFKLRCAHCHVAESPVNRLGPHLYGIVGRKAGSVDYYPYTAANKNKGVVWTRDTLFEYLKNPRSFIPGTSMIFRGIRRAEDRADVIKYLEEIPTKKIAE
ncbi:unnamed protein product [Enterobius vermicularis]|uniref:Cytochrome c domain-containing protein n=1 Tax=Enterobius vermicularis TaxID=51028 RepID=A0A0N4UUG6_ENTVE|nr:unnamed protein product [Enterobius vermicularis]